MFAIDIKNLKKLKNYILKKNKLFPSFFYSQSGHEYETIFEDEELIEIIKTTDLNNNIEEYQGVFNHV